ncbi:MAG: hypothetical protein M0Q43_08270 [Methanothrix sp.]|jgi:hypothetical protein|nr:hypothetical protein [Methanothrix sp.]
MKTPTKPTSVMLVGFLFICIFLAPATALQQPSGLEQLNKLMDQHQKSSGLGMLKVGADTINFPWSSQEDLHVRPNLPGSTSRSLKKEEIVMDSFNSTANVRDLSAMNSQIQRDLIFKDSLEKDPDNEGLVNSQEIGVSGIENDESADKVAKTKWQEDRIGGREPDNKEIHNAGNYLSIDVQDISVSAINTIQGGSAVATSNIIIEPVQIIVCPPEVGVKLK